MRCLVCQPPDREATHLDDKQNTGSPDRDRTNLSEDYEVRYWMSELGLTEEQLRSIVGDVGNSVAAVRKTLQE